MPQLGATGKLNFFKVPMSSSSTSFFQSPKAIASIWVITYFSITLAPIILHAIALTFKYPDLLCPYIAKVDIIPLVVPALLFIVIDSYVTVSNKIITGYGKIFHIVVPIILFVYGTLSSSYFENVDENFSYFVAAKIIFLFIIFASILASKFVLFSETIDLAKNPLPPMIHRR